MSQLNSKQLKLPVNITGSLYGTASYALTASYAMNGGGGGGGGTPGGTTTQIQFNNDGTFDGVPTLTYSGSTLRASGSFSGSFQGLIDSASYALNASTASYIAGYVLSSSTSSMLAPYVLSSQTSSMSVNSASYASTASYYGGSVVSASYAATASYAPGYLPLTGGTINGNLTITGTGSIAYLNVTYESASVIYSSGSNQFGDAADDVQTLYGEVNIPTGSLRVSGSTTITGSLTVTSGITGSLYGSSSYALSSSQAQNSVSSSYALTASYAITSSYSVSSSYSLSSSYALSSSYSLSASYSVSSSRAVSSSYALTASYVLNAVSSSFASTASYVNPLNQNVIITGSLTVSGSAGTTLLNSNVDTLILTGSMIVTGSSIITGSLSILGSVNATSYTGSLFGTASYSVQSLSSSFATSASYYQETDPVFVAKSASLATTGSNIFIGNQIVTGSLFTTGSNTLIGNTTLTGSLNISGSTTQVGNNTLLGNTILSGSIVISGSIAPGNLSASVNIYGDTAMTGFLRFNPYSTNIDTSISASYIYVSGSTQDLYFSQNGAGFSNTTRLRWLEGNLYTGLLSGGIISASLGTNTYYVSSGSGVIVNLNAATSSRDPYPIIQYLQWDTLSKTIDALSASFDQQFVAIDNTNAIYAKGTPYTDGDYNTKIPIGVVVHQNHSTINAFQTFPSVAYGWKQRSNDFIKAFGPLKVSGYVLAPSGSSTGSLVVGDGIAWVDGRNYTIDPNNPSYIDEAVGLTVSKIYRYYQRATLNDWIYDTNGGVGYATIDPTQYSSGTTLVPLSNPNKWSIQRVFYFPNSATKAFYIYYGNAEYESEAAALAAVNTETFTEAPNTAASAIYLGYMLLKKTADFTSATSFKIYQGGLYRGSGTGGGGGGGSTTPGGDPNTIQYNNAGAFGGITNFKWNGTSLEYTGSFITTGSLIVTGSATFTDSILIDSTLVTSSIVTTTGAGNTTISTQATGSYRSMFAKYTVSNSTNARAGEFMAVWNAENIQFTDTSTTDIGDTSALVLTGSLTTTSVQLSTGVGTGWTIKTQTTYI